MGWWANTTYINTSDWSRVAKVMTELFEEEGMRRVPRPPRPRAEGYPAMQYQTGLENNLWGVAVFPGSENWTIIKTAPLDLLAERAKGASCMRLVELCKRLATPGFQYNVYDSSEAVLAEVDAGGRLALSGFADLGEYECEPFYGEEFTIERYDPRFEWLQLSDWVATLDHQEMDQALCELLGGDNCEFCDNLTSVETLVQHYPLEAYEGHELYFKWPANDRKSLRPDKYKPPPPGYKRIDYS